MSSFGVVVIIAARRARNAEATERNRPAPPVLPGKCSQMHGCPPNSGSRRTSGPGHHQVLEVQADGLVSKSDREGASPSGPASLRRSGRSSDGAWLKTTRARRETAGLHQSSWQEAGSPAAGLIRRLFPCNGLARMASSSLRPTPLACRSASLHGILSAFSREGRVIRLVS